MSEEEMDEDTREEFWGAMNHLGRDINKIGSLLTGATVHMVTSSAKDEEIQAHLADGDIVYNVQTKEVRLKFDVEGARGDKPHDHGCCDGLWTHSLDCANSTDPWAELENVKAERDELKEELEAQLRLKLGDEITDEALAILRGEKPTLIQAEKKSCVSCLGTGRMPGDPGEPYEPPCDACNGTGYRLYYPDLLAGEDK